MTEKDHEDFNNSTKCWICKKACEGGKVKVKDQDHVTGKYRGSAHQECNLNFILTKKFFAMFHNQQNYNSQLIFLEIRKYDFKTNAIPKTIEKDMFYK